MEFLFLDIYHLKSRIRLETNQDEHSKALASCKRLCEDRAFVAIEARVPNKRVITKERVAVISVATCCCWRE